MVSRASSVAPTQSETVSSPGRAVEFDRRNLDWYIDKAVQVLVFVCGISAIVFIIGIFVFVTKEGFGFIVNTLDLREFFLSPKWRPTSEVKETYGILALIAGTASVTGLAMLVAIPFSLGAAIYIAEFATGKTRELLKVMVELLAAIPSVVWGFIGLSIMNPLIIELFDVPIGLNVLNAGLILGLMAAPIMTSIAEDALKAVPDRYREAAEAHGRHPLAGDLEGCSAGRQERPAGRGVCSALGRGFRGNHGGADGHRAFDQHADQRVRLGACVDRHHRRGTG